MEEGNLASRVYLHCKICSEKILDPVITLCGHPFCWGCLHDWKESKQADPFPCPVCSDAIDTRNIVPIYMATEQISKKRKERTPPPRPRTNFDFINGLIQPSDVKNFTMINIFTKSQSRPLLRYNMYVNSQIPSFVRLLSLLTLVSLPWLFLLKISKPTEQEASWFGRLLKSFISKF